ncbi:MAG: ROK family protein [Candidatus Omnitrophica bacterium]|nr:ROK family protein [Candidatus Omnitrophota bacterium]MCM8827962.1 ROK family protein [Candidatus Omnitrophota bacterium]
MKKAIGVDLGGTYIKYGLVDETGKILKSGMLPTKAEEKNRDVVIEQISLAIKNVWENDIEGIGIGTPGVVDNYGAVFESPNLPDWHNFNVKEVFEKKFNKLVVVENDANSIAWGEYLFGAGKGTRAIVCLTLGTGLGGGVVINGKLLRGAIYSAAELGHMPVDYKGRKCGCGSTGCIEAYVGRDYIVHSAIRKIKMGKESVLTEMAGNLSEITPKMISEAYQKGDKVAEEVWVEMATALGAFLAGMVNMLNPDRIILAGGIAQAGEILFSTVRKTIKERAMRVLSETVEVVPAGLGNDSGIVSGAALVFQK